MRNTRQKLRDSEGLIRSVNINNSKFASLEKIKHHQNKTNCKHTFEEENTNTDHYAISLK